MWKVSDVFSIELERYGPDGYGFNVTTDWDKPLVTFGYETQEETPHRRSMRLLSESFS